MHNYKLWQRKEKFSIRSKKQHWVGGAYWRTQWLHFSIPSPPTLTNCCLEDHRSLLHAGWCDLDWKKARSSECPIKTCTYTQVSGCFQSVLAEALFDGLLTNHYYSCFTDYKIVSQQYNYLSKMTARNVRPEHGIFDSKSKAISVHHT